MKYISTRGQADILDFEGATLAGLARDGGLYVPESYPTVSVQDMRNMAGASYEDVAFRILSPYVGDCIDTDSLKAMLHTTYGTGAFRHPAVAPLVQVGPQDWILELFHGPTLAFKDFALQLLGRFFDHFTARHSNRLTILGATSGDTGSAAIEACRGRDNVSIFMLHPRGRVSEVQRRQMTSVLEPNVHNIAIDGTFDDCQALVKAAFNDHAFRDAVGLTAVNSINWARVMAQVVYYFVAGAALGAPDRSLAFSVPTGNFGDIFAGYIAKKMGLPIDRLVIATNSNDILARTLATGTYSRGDVFATLSPSMDIQVSSNFERMVFDLSGRNAKMVAAYMNAFAKDGAMTLSDAEHNTAKALFTSARVDDETTRQVIDTLYRTTGYIADPHTAVGLKAAETLGDHPARITLSTAHPVKFGLAVADATGITPALPRHMADLMEREERYQAAPNDVDALKSHIQGIVS